MTSRAGIGNTHADRLDARIAVLESHQAGRHAHIGQTEKLIERKQREIDNLRNLRNQLDASPEQRAIQLWGPDDDEDPASCE